FVYASGSSGRMRDQNGKRYRGLGSHVTISRIFSPDVRIYPLTDAKMSGLSHAEQVRRLSLGGASLVQLREKHMTPRKFFREAEEALIVARRQGVQIIINDRVDFALALKADGVHLGQDDLPADAARRVLGDKAIIGLSTHSVQQAINAVRLPVDYVAIGPIFETSSKSNPASVVGLEGLRKVREAIGQIDLVAIGGITPENAGQVLEAGADAVALIFALLAAPNAIAERTRNLVYRLSSPPEAG
ncbi:MAG: thiamine phosphate synthase, partial [Pyrinomonadaceae bacterium]